MCRNNGMVMEIPISSLKDKAQKVFERMMGISQGNTFSIYQKEEFVAIKKNVDNQITIKALLKKADSFFGEKCVIGIEEKKIEHAFPLKDFPSLIQDIYVFLVSIELENKTESVMEQFLYHTWECAYLEVARGWLRQWIWEKERSFVSGSLSPGFYGISMNAIEELYSILEGERIGVLLQGKTLVPKQSAIGMYCVMKQEISLIYKQCDTCLAKGKHCEFCIDESEMEESLCYRFAAKEIQMKGETR